MTVGVAEHEIRRARHGDVPALVRLCLAHAAYERVELPENGQVARLERALFVPPPRVFCLVVESDGDLVGFATWSRELSTWRAEESTHLDCLYLEPAYRGRGLGRALMAGVAAEGASRAGAHIERQTPAWNAPAIRFYERLGAHGLQKVRFTWRPGEGPPPAHRHERARG